MRRDEFRDFLREFYTRQLVEADVPENLQPPEDKGETSLDEQVDRFFISYEKESKNVKKESRDYRRFVRRFLTEADDDPAAAPDASAPPPAGGDEGDEDKEPPKKKLKEIDIEKFSESVVRLIENYDSLLDVRDTLVRRAQKFLRDGYDEETVSAFKSVMRDTFDVEVGMSDMDKQEKYQAPPAARAGGGGGAGG